MFGTLFALANKEVCSFGGLVLIGVAAQALPFLAELLEDPEPGVAARARSLCRRLEALSGESLDPYLHG